MQLPFTHQQFLDLFADYNQALWPAVLALWMVTIAALLHLYLAPSHRGRVLAGVMALQWAWSGAVYHLVFFRRINGAAAFFGAAFLVQAGLLFWRGVIKARLTFDPKKPMWGIVAAALILYSILYPGISLLAGLRVPRFPSFGVPCPTMILTAGLLLLVPRGEARRLGIIPALWAAIGGSAAFLLAIRADLALPVAGAILLAYMLTRDPRTRGAPRRPRDIFDNRI